MEKTFWIDPYQQILATRVQAVQGNDVLLEKTPDPQGIF